MVKKVDAWEASDGTVHGSQFAAAEHEAKSGLSAIDGLNAGNITAIINNREKVWDALSSLSALEQEERPTCG